MNLLFWPGMGSLSWEVANPAVAIYQMVKIMWVWIVSSFFKQTKLEMKTNIYRERKVGEKFAP